MNAGTVARFLLPALALLVGVDSAASETIRVGILASSEPLYELKTSAPFVQALEESFPLGEVETVRLSEVRLLDEIRIFRPDVVILSSSEFLRTVDAFGAHPVAARRPEEAQSAEHSAGAALLVRNDRTDLRDLQDLKGERAAATTPNAIEGWLALSKELHDAGEDPGHYFENVRFLTHGFPDAVLSVLSGSSDVAVVPACLLEEVEASGLVARGALRVVHAKKDDELACAHSTALYPGLIAATLPWTSPETARRIAVALFSGPALGQPGAVDWVMQTNFHELRELERALGLGAWARRSDWRDIWTQWKTEICAGFGILLLLLLDEWRVRRLVLRRTEALRHTLAERDRIAEAEAQARKRLERLSRVGAVTQLCAMIAHELKQPLGALINYAAVIRMRAKREADRDPIAERAAEGIGREARRAADIVDAVRDYARREKRPMEKVDLARSAERAAESARRYAGRGASGTAEVSITVDLHGSAPAFVSGRPLELELLVVNLLKNAVDAAKTAEIPGRVHLALSAGEDEILLSVEDNGPKLSEANLERLREAGSSMKAEGLGLGLSIVRGIADEHGAKLSFRPLEPQGLAALVRFRPIKEA